MIYHFYVGDHFLGRFSNINVSKVKNETIQIGKLFYEFYDIEPMDETNSKSDVIVLVDEIKINPNDVPKNIYKIW